MTDLLDAARAVRDAFEPLKEASGAAFLYGLFDHRVHDANPRAGALWGFALGQFVGRSDGVFRLWVNPLDWLRHGDELRKNGFCIGLPTRLRGWDGRISSYWVSSLRLVVDAEPLVLCYALPIVTSSEAVIAGDDVPRLAEVLGLPAGDDLRCRAGLRDRKGPPDMLGDLLNPSPALPLEAC